MKSSIIFTLLFLTAGSVAAQDENEEPLNALLDARECVALFGDAETIKENTEKRNSCLDSLTIYDNSISLVHHGDWTDPQAIQLIGLDLEDINYPMGLEEEETAHRKPVAYLRLDDEMEDVDCQQGVYSLHVDDALGEDGRIIAILPNMILMELGGVLRYLALDPTYRPVWRISWRSTWKILKLPSKQRVRSSSNRGNRHKSRHRRKKR